MNLVNSYDFYIKEVATLLGVDNSYDDELQYLIEASNRYLVNAGCTEPSSKNDDYFGQYVFALYCNIKITFDENVNSQIFMDMRDTTVESLRSNYDY